MADIAISSAEVVGSIDDLLMQILLRLPLRSLERSKLVSKHWKSLITGHQFSLSRYRGRNPAVGLIHPFAHTSRFDYIPLDAKNPIDPPFEEFRLPSPPCWIHQSCNGLLLCCTSGEQSPYCRSFWNHDIERVWNPISSCYVYNPTTKRFAEIPGMDEFLGITFGVNLAFDPAVSPDYKVVCVRGTNHDAVCLSEMCAAELFQIEMYSSETGVWRACGEPFNTKARLNYGVYWNGSIHWICDWPRELLYFNVNKEKLRKASLPPAMSASDSIAKCVCYFGESGDHLHIVERYGKEEGLFNVYEMERDYSEWFVRYRVDVTMAAAAFPQIDNIVHELIKVFHYGPIYALSRGEEWGGCSFLVLRACGKIIRHNLDRNIWEKIADDTRHHGREYLLPCAFEHIESLASV